MGESIEVPILTHTILYIFDFSHDELCAPRSMKICHWTYSLFSSCLSCWSLRFQLSCQTPAVCRRCATIFLFLHSSLSTAFIPCSAACSHSTLGFLITVCHSIRPYPMLFFSRLVNDGSHLSLFGTPTSPALKSSCPILLPLKESFLTTI
jgi:hypothetical protein